MCPSVEMVPVSFKVLQGIKSHVMTTLVKADSFNPLPDDKMLGLPKFKALADNKFNVTSNFEVVS